MDVEMSTKKNRRKGNICTNCNGKGTIPAVLENGMSVDHAIKPVECPVCGGRGWVTLKKLF